MARDLSDTRTTNNPDVSVIFIASKQSPAYSGDMKSMVFAAEIGDRSLIRKEM